MSPALDQLRSDFTATKYYVIAWTGILIWDWLALLPREIKHFWKFKGKLSPVRITFLLNRYGTLILQMFNLALLLSTVPNGKSVPSPPWFVPERREKQLIRLDVLRIRNVPSSALDRRVHPRIRHGRV